MPDEKDAGLLTPTATMWNAIPAIWARAFHRQPLHPHDDVGTLTPTAPVPSPPSTGDLSQPPLANAWPIDASQLGLLPSSSPVLSPHIPSNPESRFLQPNSRIFNPTLRVLPPGRVRSARDAVLQALSSHGSYLRRGVVTGADYQHHDVARSRRRRCDAVYVLSRHGGGAASAVRVEDSRESADQRILSGCESVCILSLIHLHLVTTILSRLNFARLAHAQDGISSPENTRSSTYPTGLSYLATTPPGKQLISCTGQTPTGSGMILGQTATRDGYFVTRFEQTPLRGARLPFGTALELEQALLYLRLHQGLAFAS